MRIIGSVVLSSLMLAPGLAAATSPIEGRFWNGRWESSGASGEVHVGLEAVKSVSVTLRDEHGSTEYSGTVRSVDVQNGRVVIHGTLAEHRTSGVRDESTPFDTGWQPLTEALTIMIEGTQLPTVPYKVDVIVGTLTFTGASPEVPEWLPGTQATVMLSSFGSQ